MPVPMPTNREKAVHALEELKAKASKKAATPKASLPPASRTLPVVPAPDKPYAGVSATIHGYSDDMYYGHYYGGYSNYYGGYWDSDYWGRSWSFHAELAPQSYGDSVFKPALDFKRVNQYTAPLTTSTTLSAPVTYAPTLEEDVWVWDSRTSSYLDDASTVSEWVSE